MFVRRLLRLFFSLCLCLNLVALMGCTSPNLTANLPGSIPPATATASYPATITVEELARRIDAGDDSYWLIDVRTAEEVAIATIPTSTHIPMTEIEDGSAIPSIQAKQGDRQIILHCYSGVRSRRAQKQLAEAGIATTDMLGGIKAWRKQIDPSLPRKLLP